MKSYRKELFFNIPERRGIVNITRQVQAAVNESGIKEGLVLVNAMNITASVFINDDEPGLHNDFENCLKSLPLNSHTVSMPTMALKTMPTPT